MKIHELGKDPGRAKKKKRVGRGEASGLGKREWTELQALLKE